MAKFNRDREKDRILKYLLKHKELNSSDLYSTTSSALNIDAGIADTLFKELNEDNYVSYPIKFGTEGDLSITTNGEIFIKEGGYSKLARNKWWEEFPKKYWLLGAIGAALLAILAALSPEIFKEWRKSKEKPAVISVSHSDSTFKKTDTLEKKDHKPK